MATDKDFLVLALAHLEFLKTNEKLKLQHSLNSFEELVGLSALEISLLCGREITSKLWPFYNLENAVKSAFLLMKTYKIGFVHIEDERYPFLLKQIYDPPFLLFYRGNFDALKTPSISVVGSRRASSYGLKVAYDFSSDLAKNDFAVVSGLAFGIDACAHKGALSQNGKTIAILACGLDSVYPYTNRKIAQNILQKEGCILSEYPPQVQAVKYHFPARNRIISGLSQATVVMESPPKSGALITADFALEQNRELFFHKSAVDFDLKFAKDFMKGQSEKNAKIMQLCRVSKYVEDGAFVIDTVDELLKALLNESIRHDNKFL